MQSNKLLSMIGMSKKAGKLIMGFDAVADGIKRSTVELVLVAEDISSNSRTAISQIAQKHAVTLRDIPLTMEQLEQIIRKQAGILGIANPDFAAGIDNIIMAEG